MIRFLAPALAIIFAACATPGAPPVQTANANATPQGPALWRVADDDTTIWLFGTIHVLPADLEWRHAALNEAIDAADELVLETVLSGEGDEAAALLMRLGISPDLPPIAERIEPDRQPQLARMIERGQFPESFLDALETWAAALMLVGVTIEDLGLGSDEGAEEELETAFEAAGKPRYGLETPIEQLGYLDTLPETAQRFFLSSVVDAPEDARAEFDAMLDAWIRGDEAAIAATFDDELAESAELRNALIVQRNRAWAEWIAARLDQPGAVLVAVGAGHLAGRDSVQAMLGAAGIESARIQ